MQSSLNSAEYFVTCANTICENKGIQIEVQATKDKPLVICGPCSTPITKIVPVNA